MVGAVHFIVNICICSNQKVLVMYKETGSRLKGLDWGLSITLGCLAVGGPSSLWLLRFGLVRCGRCRLPDLWRTIMDL